MLVVQINADSTKAEPNRLIEVVAIVPDPFISRINPTDRDDVIKNFKV